MLLHVWIFTTSAEFSSRSDQTWLIFSSPPVTFTEPCLAKTTCNRTPSGKTSLRRQTPAGFPPELKKCEKDMKTMEKKVLLMTKGVAGEGVHSPERKGGHAWCLIQKRVWFWFIEHFFWYRAEYNTVKCSFCLANWFQDNAVICRSSRWQTLCTPLPSSSQHCSSTSLQAPLQSSLTTKR